MKDFLLPQGCRSMRRPIRDVLGGRHRRVQAIRGLRVLCQPGLPEDLSGQARCPSQFPPAQAALAGGKGLPEPKDGDPGRLTDLPVGLDVRRPLCRHMRRVLERGQGVVETQSVEHPSPL